jgi:hypothetical protein
LKLNALLLSVGAASGVEPNVIVVPAKRG